MTHFRLQVGLCHKYIASLLLKIFIIRYFFISPLPMDFHSQQITKHPAYSSIIPVNTWELRKSVWCMLSSTQNIQTLLTKQLAVNENWLKSSKVRTHLERVLTCKQWPLLTINDIHICVCNPFLQYSLI